MNLENAALIQIRQKINAAGNHTTANSGILN